MMLKAKSINETIPSKWYSQKIFFFLAKRVAERQITAAANKTKILILLPVECKIKPEANKIQLVKCVIKAILSKRVSV
ncbi:hypothetical protein D3C85_1670410 [compost metagenome]